MVAPTRRRPAAAPATSGGYRGAEGRRKMEEEQERQEAQREASKQMSNMPFRFYCPVGETREYVIIDESPDFFRHEHNLKNSRTNRWDIFCACINDTASCPVCKLPDARDPYFAMYLTILDLTPYTNRDGDEVPWSKKLLVVKPAQQKKFTRLFDREGTLRGMVMTATRDGEKDAAIGNDQEFTGDFMSEDELAEYVDEYTDKKDKVHHVIGNEVFDYDALFPAATEQQLRALVGGKAEPGSREDNERSVGGRGGARSRGDDWEEGARRPARGAAPPARRGRAAEPEPEEGEEETEEAAPPARRARAAAPAPAPTRRAAPPAPAAPARRTRAAEPVEEEEEAYEEEEDAAPPPRRVAPRQAAAPARRTRVEPAEEEAAEEDPPQRGGVASLAEKRRALRRGG